MEHDDKRDRIGKPVHRAGARCGLQMAQAVVVLLTPDDVAYLRHEYASGDGDPERSGRRRRRTSVSRLAWRWGTTPTKPFLWNSDRFGRSATLREDTPYDSMIRPRSATYTTAFWFAASRNHSALSFGIRVNVLKST